ncbi:MAG TPA: rod shape-determining protein MreC [Verrucomicrobiae bacterium]|nr:rod shape-determining protein MreC [Verrucomicrobiae bacterium]
MIRRYLFLLTFSILLLFVPIVAVGPLRNAAVRVVSPVARYLTDRNLTLQNWWLNLTSIDTIREDRNRLQQRVIDLQRQVIATESLQRENEDLRKELGVTTATREMPKVFTRIILQGDNPLDYTFTVDAGRAQGIRVGQPAIAQGSLIGRVIEVREQTAVIRSITSLQSKIQAWLTPTQEKGFLVGTGNGVILEDISQGVDIPQGAIVETSGLGGSLPQGILIGEVDSLQSAKSDLAQTFRVRLPLDPVRVQSLFITLIDQP